MDRSYRSNDSEKSSEGKLIIHNIQIKSNYWYNIVDSDLEQLYSMQSPEDIYFDRSYRSNDSEKSSEGKQKSNVSTSSSINDSNINNNPLISCVKVEIQNRDGGKNFFEVV